MKLSIIVPCYNEESSVDEFYNQLTTKLNEKKIGYEIIFVDDGSKDDTSNKIEEIIKKDKCVKLISFSRNFGKESAMLAGLDHATLDYIAIMDADMQHTPSMLISMYEKLIDNKEYDVVCAYKAKRNDENPIKRTLTSIFYQINNHISEVKLLPGASDFRVFKKDVKDAILTLKENKRFLKGIFSWIGFNTIYVPYQPEKRLYGKSKWSIIKLIKYSLDGMISFSTMPLKALFMIGVVIFIIGLLNFILMGHLSSKTIILFVSIIMLSIGVISLYVERIYNNVLKRPNYIIKKELGFSKKTTK